MKSLVNLLASLQGLDASSFTNETERVQARDALFEALRRIQSPWDIAWDHCWVSPAVSACVKTLIDVRVFQKWAEAGHGPITCPQLAELTGADGLLLQRMMRCLAGQHLVVETAADTYLPTPWARNFASHAAFKGCYGGLLGELTSPLSCVLPEFLEHSKYKNPVDSAQGAFQYWQGADTSLFTWAGQNERFRVDFNDAMECHSQYNLTPWTEVYPTDTIIADGKAKPDRKLVLDIGGGKGHDLLKFLGRHAEECPEGSLVLQDLPDILKGVRFESKAIEIQPHDFFTEQPVKGARAYFMHNVIHDWPNEDATKILSNIAAAMEKGYSRLLLHESLVTSEKPLARVTVSDIHMMMCFSSAERSEKEWAALVASAGLKLVKIWRPVQSVESIIEAELA